MTKRCKFCGVKMSEAEIDGNNVWQCPVCGFVQEKPETAAVEATGGKDVRRDLLEV